MRRAWLLGAVLLSCGPAASSEPTSFIALDRDFADFEAWEVVHLEGATIDAAHPAGARSVYLNARPPPGRSTWPVGTVLVKVSAERTLAMAKRGATYNVHGAVGWEWFELTRDAAGTPRIVWRGLGAPVGESYEDSDQTCNACHGAHVVNDSVLTAGFQLLRP